MIDNTNRALVYALALTLLSALLVPAGANAQDPGMTRLYAVENVSLDSAETLANSICSEVHRLSMAAGNREEQLCQVWALSRENKLAVTAPPHLQTRIAAMLGELDRLPETKAFHVIVLAAAAEGPGGDLDIPAAARQALEDFAALMPYSSFRVLGSGLLRTSRRAQTTLPGPEEFQVAIQFRSVSDPEASILIEGFEIYKETLTTINDSVQRIRHRVLETTFTIAPGETAVVGTSARDGQEGAIVVLLTAVER
jgi:hypothetical protein